MKGASLPASGFRGTLAGIVARTVIALSVSLTCLAGCADEPPSDGPGGARSSATAPTSPPTATTTPQAPAARQHTQAEGSVVYISDGDTVGVKFGATVVRIRLLGIDAPETKDPDAPVACYGPQSAARVATLVPKGSRVRVVTDPSQDERDKFGRLLAYVFARGATVSINEQLLRDGAARLYLYRRNRPIERIAAFRTAEQAARTAKRGLWGACAT